MAIAKIGDIASQATKGANVTTLVFTVGPGGATIGNLIILRFSGQSVNPTITSVADTGGNVYTANSQQVNTDTSEIWSAPVTTALVNGNTITMNHAAWSNGCAGVAEEWSGVNTIDGTPAVASGSSATPSAGPVTPTATGYLLVGHVGVVSVIGDAYTEDADSVDGTWTSATRIATSGNPTTGNAISSGGYKISTGTSAQTYNPTIASAAWSENLASFSAAAGTPAAPNVNTPSFQAIPFMR